MDRDAMVVLDLISNETRAKIVSMIAGRGEMCPGEIGREAGVTPEYLSQVLKKLVFGGILSRRRQGRHLYYGVDRARIRRAAKSLNGLVAQPRKGA